MAKVRSWAGLDVHARSVLAVTLDARVGRAAHGRLPGEAAKVVEFLAKLPGATRVAYEAGPTGYGLARELHAVGIGCVVAAPGKIERPAQDKIKTDQRDAERVLRLLMIDALHAVRVPTVEEEALRDLVRAREDLRGDLMRARQRLASCCCATGSSTRTPRAPGPAASRLAARSGSRRRRASDIAGLPRRDRHARAPPRPTRDDDRRAGARLAVRADRRPVAVPARCRHALGRRAGRRDRRLWPLRPARTADELHRAGALGVQLGRDPPSGQDHQDRLQARPPAAGRGRMALPQDPRPRRHPPAPPGRPARHHRRDLLAGATPTARRLAAPRRAARQGAARSSRSRWPANSPDSAGRSPARTEPASATNATSVKERRDLAHAREHQRSNCEQARSRPTLDL